MAGFRLSVLTAIVGSSGLSGAQASSAPVYQLNIPRERIALALADFARETGLQVARLSDAEDPALYMNAVVGVYTAEQALRLMLANSGYDFRVVNERTIAIVRGAGELRNASPAVSGDGPSAETPEAKSQTSIPAPSRSMSLLAGLFAALSAGTVAAEAIAPPPGDSGELQEVVVTAQRRAERLLDVPISVEAFTANQLEASGVTGTTDLPLVTPGLVFGQQDGEAQPFLRGVGTVASGPGVESPVALYIDNVYYGAMPGGFQSFANIDQVEVDKGPQGTLFGRNATGGLIQITTKDPSQTATGVVSATYGNYATAGTDLYLTGGLTSYLAADLSVHFSHQNEGYGENLVTGDPVSKTQEFAVRNKWLFTTSDGTEFKWIFDYERTDFIPNYGPAPGNVPLGAPPYRVPPQDIAGLIQPSGETTQGGVSLYVKHDLAFAKFISISAYRGTELVDQAAASLTIDPAYTIGSAVHEKHDQITQEFQLSSLAAGRTQWTAGLYLYDADAGLAPGAVSTGGLLTPLTYVNNYDHQRSYSGAVYGQTTTEVADATNLTVGLRYTWERRDFDGSETLGFPGGTSQFFSDREHEVFDKATWRIALDHHFTPDFMAYVSDNRGFKSGGFNDSLVPTIGYAPEVLDAYEIGSKIDVLDHHLSVNAAAFLYNYKNIQEIQFLSDGNVFLYNGAAAKVYGLDLDARLKVIDSLSLIGAVEAIHSYFSTFPGAPISTPMPGGGTAYSTGSVAGNRLALTPDFTGSLTAEYTIPLASYGKASLSSTYAYDSGWFAEPDNRLHQGAYHVVNAEGAWSLPGDLWRFRLWGKNLTNSEYTTALGSQPNGDFAVFAPPRTFGITVQRKF